MKIYEIRVDIKNTQWLLPINQQDTSRLMNFNCTPLLNNWEPINLYVDNPIKESGDFIQVGYGTFGFLGNLHIDMLSIIEMAGEILECRLEDGEKVNLLNILSCYNALNIKACEWEYYPNGDKRRIKKYAFHSDRLGESSLFKVPDFSKTSIFAYSGLKYEEDEFYYLYNNLKLKGLIFNEVWSD